VWAAPRAPPAAATSTHRAAGAASRAGLSVGVAAGALLACGGTMRCASHHQAPAISMQAALQCSSRSPPGFLMGSSLWCTCLSITANAGALLDESRNQGIVPPSPTESVCIPLACRGAVPVAWIRLAARWSVPGPLPCGSSSSSSSSSSSPSVGAAWCGPPPRGPAGSRLRGVAHLCVVYVAGWGLLPCSPHHQPGDDQVTPVCCTMIARPANHIHAGLTVHNERAKRERW